MSFAFTVLPAVFFILGIIMAFSKDADEKLLGECLAFFGILAFAFYAICVLVG